METKTITIKSFEKTSGTQKETQRGNKMTIICPYCSSEIQIKDYDAHAIAAHPEETERRALLSIETAQAQVEYIYNHHPETKQDNGLLIFHFAQGYPKLALREEAQSYTISAKYADFFYFLKRANSITRLGRHIRQPEKTGETIGSSISLKSAVKTKDAVRQVLEQVPQARYNEGVLAERVLRYYQPQGVEMQYNKEAQEITLKAPKALMLAVLRHIETISRASRKLRSTLNFEGSSAVPAKREVEYAYSTKEWAERGGGDWLPNTYIPMRD
jgi:hypothetical protein